MRPSNRLLAPAVGLVALSLPVTAHATTYRVTREDESPLPCSTNNCSLRSAVAAVNAGSGGDVIVLPSGNYVTTDTELTITKEATIDGAGARSTTITAGGADHRLLHIQATVEVRDLRLTGGKGDSGGAAFVPATGDLTVRNVLADTNTGDLPGGPAYGGAFDVLGTLTVTGSLVTNNVAKAASFSGSSRGGGISTREGGTTTVVASTISANTADVNTGWGQGGGFYTTAGSTLTVANTTVAGNEAVSPTPGGDPFGGNIRNEGTTTLRGSIVTGGIGMQGHENCSGPITSQGHNIAGTADCSLAGPGDRQGINARLGALANNGGPTDTMAISRTSPAFDSAPPGACPGTDQRGVARPQGARCDIGAFELVVGGGGLPGPGPAAPNLTGLTVRPPTFVLGNFLPAASQRRRRGTTIAFTLSEAARTTLTFTRKRPGRRVRGRCVKPRRRNLGRPRCRRTVVAGRIRIELAAGAQAIRFSGRLTRRKRLRPGRYGLVVTARDAGGLRSAPARTRLRAVARKRR